MVDSSNGQERDRFFNVDISGDRVRTRARGSLGELRTKRRHVMKTAGNRIRQARRKAGLSQAQLAAMIGVGRSAVAQWEHRTGAHPTVEHMTMVAIAMDVRFEWLATGRGPMRYPDEAEMDGDGTPALMLTYFAQNDLEERALLAFRQLDDRDVSAIVEMTETLVTTRKHR